MKRTAAQNKKIWGKVSLLAQRTGLGRETSEGIMREICAEISGDRSTSKLTQTQAIRLIAELSDRINQIKPAPEAKGIITRRQQVTLKGLYRDAGIRSPTGFCLRIIKKPWPQTRQDAIKVHTALTEMVLKKYPQNEVRKMLVVLSDYDIKTGLTAFERCFIANLKKQIEARGEHCLTAGKIGKLLEIYRTRVTGAREKICGTNMPTTG